MTSTFYVLGLGDNTERDKRDLCSLESYVIKEETNGTNNYNTHEHYTGEVHGAMKKMQED